MSRKNNRMGSENNRKANIYVRIGRYIVWIFETEDCNEYEAGVQDCLFLLQRSLSRL